MKKLLIAVLLASSPALADPDTLGVNPCTSALANSCILKTTGGQLFDFNVFVTTASYVMLVDSATVPGSGTVTPVKSYAVALNSDKTVSWIPNAITFFNGITLLCSSAVPPTYTPATTCIFSGETR